MRFRILRKDSHDDNMHAMIDVVFLLLIYFLCTVQFGLLEFDVPADLDLGVTKQQQQAEDFETIQIMVQAEQRGYTCNGRSFASLHTLRQHLHSIRSLIDPRLIIDADATVPFQDIMTLMDCLHELTFTKISFAGK